MHNVCKVCETKFRNNRELSINFDSDHQREDGSLCCSIEGCLTRSYSKQQMYIHVKSIHKNIWIICGETTVNCGDTYICEKKFPTKYSLRNTKKGDI